MQVARRWPPLSRKAGPLPLISIASLLPERQNASRVSDRDRSVVKLSAMTRNVPDPAQTRRRVARAWPLMRAATRALHLYVKAVMRLAPGRGRTRLLRGTRAYLAMLEHALRCLLILMGRKAPPTVRAPWAAGLARTARSTRPGAARVFSVAVGKAFAGAFRPRPIPAPPPSHPRATPTPPTPGARDACFARRLDLLAAAFRNPEPHALRMAAYIKSRGGRLRPAPAIRPDAEAFRIVSDLFPNLPSAIVDPAPDTS